MIPSLALAECSLRANVHAKEQIASVDVPMVSIVIPVKNDAGRLDVCLRSLKRQAYPVESCEIIVVDNGSTDDSAAVAASYGAKILQFPGLRVGALRNRGVRESRGEILAFVDSDHEVPSTWITSGVNVLQVCPAIRVVGAACLAPPHGTWVQRAWEKHRLRCHKRGPVPWLGAGNMFLRRADFEAAGGFAEELVAAEDVDLCVRLGREFGSIVSDPAIVNIHHGEPPTIVAFFLKEYWRGSSGLRAFIRHGMPMHELPSLLYPLYHLLCALLFVASIFPSAAFGEPLWVALATTMMLLPSLALATKTSWGCRQIRDFPSLAVLYLTYGCARAAALFKS